MPSEAAVEPREYRFEAETNRLLHLLAHSLYQSKEIAIRELISNASDALDKFRHIALTDPQHRDDATNLHIEIELREDSRDLVLRDNGVGMTHDELVRNLGTIARSGSLEFLKNLSGEAKADLSLIGQFGVGFYSAFMLADTVRVRSRSYADPQGHEWESDGTGTFTVRPVDGLPRGTEVILHLKDDARDLLKDYRIKSVIRTYSGFVPYPIRVGGEVVNDQRPIWAEPKNQVTDEQHTRFYQHLSHRGEEKPLWHLHLAVDSPIQFRAVVYCPPTNIERLGFGRPDHGLALCARRVLVQQLCRELLPDYLRFLHGLVDSEDLPLNISRETLQDNAILRKIRGTLTRSILDRLARLADEQPETFATFHEQFGVILKEGILTDPEHRSRIASVLRFRSSALDDGDKLTSLADYLNRAPSDQKEIFYLGGADLSTIRKNPALEIFRRRGVEVLYLTEPIDEFVMAELRQFEGKPLKSIDASDVQLPGPSIETPSTSGPGFSRVLDLFREALGNRVSAVRESRRLVDSPCCLVTAEGGLSPQMQRVLRQANRDFPLTGRVLEINPDSPLILRLSQLSTNPANDDFIRQCGLQLWSSSLLLEGQLVEPEGLVSRTLSFLEQAAQARPTILT